MKMEVKSPPKPSLFLTKEADCVYNDLSEQLEQLICDFYFFFFWCVFFFHRVMNS